MSIHTNIDLRKLFIYQVYTRNHTEAGTFQALIDDLDRIKAMNVDIIYLLPIHEIGEKNRKGTLGSPYAIKDYYSINPEHGTLDDFKALIKAVKKRKMKIMIDIVFNHTSPDSSLINTNPEFFYRNKDGMISNRVGDWWDVKDFDYTRDKNLYQTLIDVLLYWTKLGVDGFRFDVASLLPLEFLIEGHRAVIEENPDSIWLSESVHEGFLKYIRDQGYIGLSESEIYQVFDLAYDYDTHPAFEGYLKGESSLQSYANAVMRQEVMYPHNYIKLRNLENHDFGRIANFVNRDQEILKNWYGFVFFNRGATMIFSGSEFSNTHHPSLFDKDEISRNSHNLQPYIKQLAEMAKNDIYAKGVYDLTATEGCLIGKYEYLEKKAIGIFDVGKKDKSVNVDLVDGTYTNEINHSKVVVTGGKILLDTTPIVIHV